MAKTGPHSTIKASPPRAGGFSFSTDPFCASVREWIAAIPRGKVATYGQIARLAGKPWGARQVAWILHSQSEKYRLPWQRVIGANGRISLPLNSGFFEQRRLLRREGVKVDDRGGVDLKKFLWQEMGEFPPGKKKRDRPGRSLGVSEIIGLFAFAQQDIPIEGF